MQDALIVFQHFKTHKKLRENSIKTFLVPTGMAVTYTFYQNTDLYGGDLFSPTGAFETGKPVFQPSADSCANFCTQTPGCIGFAWSTLGDGSCWVKNGPWDVRPGSPRTSGIMNFNGFQENTNILISVEKFYLHSMFLIFDWF